MTILSTHESSRIRNAALSALHYIAYELHCEVPDILALITPSQPSQSSQAPAARMSEATDVQAEESPHGFSANHPEADIPAFLRSQPSVEGMNEPQVTVAADANTGGGDEVAVTDELNTNDDRANERGQWPEIAGMRKEGAQ